MRKPLPPKLQLKLQKRKLKRVHAKTLIKEFMSGTPMHKIAFSYGLRMSVVEQKLREAAKKGIKWLE